MKKSRGKSTANDVRVKRPSTQRAVLAAGVPIDEQARLFDISHDAIFMWREPGGIEFWNNGAAELYGYAAQEAIGKMPRDLLRTKFPQPWPAIENEIRAKGTWQGELIHHTAKGGEVIVSARLQLVAADGESIVVLESTHDVTDIRRAAERLHRRASEQAVTARFSLDALQATSVQTICDDAAHILREHLDADFSTVWESAADAKSLLLRSGIGWRPGLIGTMRISADEDTSPGRALELNQPIIISDARSDTRLQLPEFMRAHGVVSSMAVVVPGRPGPFGALCVDSKTPRAFTGDELHFLESIANVLATATSRLRFEQELRETAARLRGIVDTAVDGIITIDERGIVETMNPAAERIFGYRADEVIGRNVSMLMPEPYRSEHDGYLDRYRRTGERRIIGIGREVRGRRKDGTEFPMDLAVSATTLGNRRIFTGLVRDITARKQTELALELSEERFAKAYNASPDAIILSRLSDGQIIEVNPAWESLLGFNPHEVVGRSSLGLHLFADAADREKAVTQIRDKGAVRDFGLKIRRKSGELRDASLSAEKIVVRGEECIVAVIRDITEQKRLEREILEISDHEQRRIGNDLHDDLCQRLAGIRFSCDALKSTLNKAPVEAVQERVEKIATGLSEAIDRTRMLARGLSPVALETNGLVSALEELTDSVRTLSGASCVFKTKGTIALNDAITATHVYRITQEAINNALKHARASRLVVSLQQQDGKATLSVRDNGIGFSADGQQSDGMGLQTIAYRARMIGADLQVKSAPRKGTEVLCTFDLEG